MDLWTIVRVVVRRWYVSFPILLVAAFATIAVTSGIAPSYQVTGSVILFTPNGAQATPAGSAEVSRNNPYLSFNASLGITANALVRVLDSPDERRGFAVQKLRSDYGIQTEENFPGIRIAVVGKDGAVAVRTAQRLIDSIGERLTTLEDESGAPANQRIAVRVLDAPTAATELPPSVARIAAVIVGLGIACATGMALLLEGLARSRRNTIAARGVQSAVDEREESPPPPQSTPAAPAPERTFAASPRPAAPAPARRPPAGWVSTRPTPPATPSPVEGPGSERTLAAPPAPVTARAGSAGDDTTATSSPKRRRFTRPAAPGSPGGGSEQVKEASGGT